METGRFDISGALGLLTVASETLSLFGTVLWTFRVGVLGR